MNRRRQSEYSEQDSAVLDRLDRKFRRSLLTYFGRRTSDLSDLEDMVQDVFVRLLKRGGASELERQNLSAYVFETASSVLTDHRSEEHTSELQSLMRISYAVFCLKKKKKKKTYQDKN